MDPFLKVTQGSFHQANARFGATAGRQCTCCALFSVVFSVVKRQAYWDSKDIDFVVQNGDRVYKSLNREDYKMFNELPRMLTINNCVFSVEFLADPESKLLNYKSVPGTIIDIKNVNSQADGFLLIINGKCVSVTWNKKNLFLFDSHSRNNLGKTCPEGTATLIKFSSKKALELFIISNFVKESDGNIPYELQYNYLCL